MFSDHLFINYLKIILMQTQQIVVNGFDIEFDPTKGFLISYATVFYNGNFYCQAQLNGQLEKINFVLYWFRK